MLTLATPVTLYPRCIFDVVGLLSSSSSVNWELDSCSVAWSCPPASVTMIGGLTGIARKVGSSPGLPVNRFCGGGPDAVLKLDPESRLSLVSRGLGANHLGLSGSNALGSMEERLASWLCSVERLSTMAIPAVRISVGTAATGYQYAGASIVVMPKIV